MKPPNQNSLNFQHKRPEHRKAIDELNEIQQHKMKEL